MLLLLISIHYVKTIQHIFFPFYCGNDLVLNFDPSPSLITLIEVNIQDFTGLCPDMWLRAISESTSFSSKGYQNRFLCGIGIFIRFGSRFKF